jgi:hypothetical protein
MHLLFFLHLPKKRKLWNWDSQLGRNRPDGPTRGIRVISCWADWRAISLGLGPDRPCATPEPSDGNCVDQGRGTSENPTPSQKIKPYAAVSTRFHSGAPYVSTRAPRRAADPISSPASLLCSFVEEFVATQPQPHPSLVFWRSVDATYLRIFVLWSLRCCDFCCSSDLLACFVVVVWVILEPCWFCWMHMRSHKFMGNLHLSLPWCNNLFSPWRSDASLRPCFPSFIPLCQSLDFVFWVVLHAMSFDWFLLLLELSKRRWGDDGIVSLLVWLVAMMAKSVLALSDRLPSFPLLFVFCTFICCLVYIKDPDLFAFSILQIQFCVSRYCSQGERKVY